MSISTAAKTGSNGAGFQSSASTKTPGFLERVKARFGKQDDHGIIVDVGIDLGTKLADIIGVDRYGTVCSNFETMPSVVAWDLEKKEPKSFGNTALTHLGHPGIELIWPIEGTIRFSDKASFLIEHMANKALAKAGPIRRLVVSIPHGDADEEVTVRHCEQIKKLMNEHIGAQEVFLVEQAILAACGLKLPVFKEKPVCVVDMGGWTTQFIMMGLGKVISAHTMNLAGNYVDRQIKEYLARDHDITVSIEEAEEIKLAICNKEVEGEHYTFRTLVGGSPKQVNFSMPVKDVRALIDKVCEDMANMIVQSLRVLIQKGARKMVRDLEEIVLCGGSSQLPGLCDKIRAKTNYKVRIAENPQRAVPSGLEEILKKQDNLKLLELKGTVRPGIIVRFRNKLSKLLQAA